VRLAPWAKAQGITLPSERTLGRIIAGAADRMRHSPVRLDSKGRPKRWHRTRKTRKPKGFRATRPGQCVGFDSIERFRDGLRRYLVSAQDECSRIGFALAVPGHGSLWATGAFNLTQTVLPMRSSTPFMIMARSSRDSSPRPPTQQGPQWHTFPRTPKMNARCERFNRTLQDEFLDYHEDLLFTDLKSFNDKLFDCLLWYNTKRPHHALGLNTPASVVASCLPHTQCRMYWPNTCLDRVRGEAYRRRNCAAKRRRG